MLVLKRNLLTHLGLTCFLLLLSHFAFAQQPAAATFKGTVVSSVDNTPLEGVSVVQQGVAKGTVTLKDGTFTLKVTGNKPTISFSYVGYQIFLLKYEGKNGIVIKMEPANAELQDVVVVGYGEQKKVNQTGSTQTLKLDEAVNTPVTNASQLMYGRFAGVQLTQGSGLPGADGSTIVIRGVGSFGGTNPLVVIDNIQYDNLDAFNSLAPADIESVSVLKDASSTAIYGAKGSNGVIVVTTKKGKKGKTQVTYSYSHTINYIRKNPSEYLSASDYIRMNRLGIQARFRGDSLDNNTGAMNNDRNQLLGAWGWAVNTGWRGADRKSVV